MKKKIISLVLALTLIPSLFLMPAAAADTNQAEMLSVLAVLEVMNGDEHGNLNLGNQVTRAEFTKMSVSASTYKDFGSSIAGISPFSDVPYVHWAAGFVTTARNAGWLQGYLDGTFRPNNSITLAEAVTVVLKMLGYSDSSFTGIWPSGQMSLYRSLGLNENISAGQNDKLSRLECAWLIYNAFSAQTSAGVNYAVSLGYSTDASGNIDYLSLVNQKTAGPMVVSGSNWVNTIGFTPKTVYRNDTESSIGAVSQYDVLYYLEEISTVWAYSNKQTGTIEAVLPSRSNPTSVTIAGKNYTLGTSSASTAVSSYGTYKVGDIVTLLLGRDNTVAAVISAEEINTTVYGVVAGTGKTEYVTPSGDKYTAKYIDVVASDGVTYRYASDYSAAAGTLVSVTTGDSGVTVKKLSRNSNVTGTVNASGTAAGKIAFADNLEILDVYQNTAVSIPASRLRNTTLNSSNVLYSVLNSAGEAEILLLNDFTGDVHTYGILESSAKGPAGMTYTCIVDGAERVYSNVSLGNSVSNEPVQMCFKDNTLYQMSELKKMTIKEVGNGFVTDGKTSYSLSDRVQVYERRGGEYYLTTLPLVSNLNDYTLTGWYDKTDINGGRIRIVVASAVL